MRTVVGLFENGRGALRALAELAELGFTPQNISVVTDMATQSTIDAGGPARRREVRSSDVGTVATSGPLAGPLGAPKEALALTDILQRSGFPSDLARRYAMGVEGGATLESLTVDDADADRVAAVMKKHAGSAPLARVAKAEREAAREAGGHVFDASEYLRYFEAHSFAGDRFEEHIRAYKLGEDLAGAGSSERWEDVEVDARGRWEAERPGTWDRYEESIRYAWSRGRIR